MKRSLQMLLFVVLLSACATVPSLPTSTPSPSATLAPTSTPNPSATPPPPTPTITLAPSLTFTPSQPTLAAAVMQNSFAVGFSSDGGLLLFNSSLDGLVAGDNDHKQDPFLYHTADSVIQSIRVGSGSGPYQVSSGTAVSLSTNGQYVLYATVNASAIFRDLKNGQVIDLNFSVLDKGMDTSVHSGLLSADARYLELETYQGLWKLFLYERATGKVIDLSLSPDGQPADGDVFQAAFSPDGRFLAFVSNASNLAPGGRPCTDPNPSCGDVFLYSLATRQLERIPAHLGFIQGNPYPYLTVSSGARWLAWTEAEGEDYTPIVRLYNYASGKTETVCAPAGSRCAGQAPAISADGRWLAFAGMPASNPDGSWDKNQPSQIYLSDRQTGEQTLLSQGADGKPGDANSGIIQLQSEGWSSDVRISGDGRFVAFSSQAANLLPAGVAKQQCFDPVMVGAYPCYDLFVYNLQTRKLTWVSRPNQDSTQ